VTPDFKVVSGIHPPIFMLWRPLGKYDTVKMLFGGFVPVKGITLRLNIYNQERFDVSLSAMC
jgi:hypothetical protein